MFGTLHVQRKAQTPQPQTPQQRNRPLPLPVTGTPHSTGRQLSPTNRDAMARTDFAPHAATPSPAGAAAAASNGAAPATGATQTTIPIPSPAPTGDPRTPRMSEEVLLEKYDSMALDDSDDDAPEAVDSRVNPTDLDKLPAPIVRDLFRERVITFLRKHRATELVPISGKVVVLDVDLKVRHAFYAMAEHGELAFDLCLLSRFWHRL